MLFVVSSALYPIHHDIITLSRKFQSRKNRSLSYQAAPLCMYKVFLKRADANTFKIQFKLKRV